MANKSCEKLDPRIRRTREMLHRALQKLLENKEFEEISVQDIAEAARVNRATFYDHYADKYALLECSAGSEFHELLAERQVQFGEGCSSALTVIVLAVCDYLARVQGTNCQRQLQPHTEAAIIGTVRGMLLEGLKLHPSEGAVPPEMRAATTSWAIYGAAKEWVQTPDRCSSDEIADVVMKLVLPIFGQPQDVSA